jgi:hypothetical protein
VKGAASLPAQRRSGFASPGSLLRRAFRKGSSMPMHCCATLLLPIRQAPTPTRPCGATWNGTSNGSSYLHQPVRPARKHDRGQGQVLSRFPSAWPGQSGGRRCLEVGPCLRACLAGRAGPEKGRGAGNRLPPVFPC